MIGIEEPATVRPDFNRVAADGGRWRTAYPARIYETLAGFGVGLPGQRVVDLGTGAGHFARGFARKGCLVIGLDCAGAPMAEGEWLDSRAGVKIGYRVGRAEATGLAARSFDAVLAAQAWPWFHRAIAAREARRLLKPGGLLAITQYDWIPGSGTVAAATIDLVRRLQPEWQRPNTVGVYPEFFDDLAAAGFEALECWSFDVAEPYTRDGWRGRMRASGWIGALLAPELVARIDADLKEMLERLYRHEPFTVPHRSWTLVGRAPR